MAGSERSLLDFLWTREVDALRGLELREPRSPRSVGCALVMLNVATVVALGRRLRAMGVAAVLEATRAVSLMITWIT
jgi:hypothetical protein